MFVVVFSRHPIFSPSFSKKDSDAAWAPLAKSRLANRVSIMQKKKKVKLGGKKASKEGGSRKHERTVPRVEVHLSFTVPTENGVTVPHNCEPLVMQPDVTSRVGGSGRNDLADCATGSLAGGSSGGRQDGRTAGSGAGVGGAGSSAGDSASGGRLAGDGWTFGVSSSIWDSSGIGATPGFTKPTVKVRACVVCFYC